MLLNAAKCQSYSSYRLWVIKGEPTGGGKITPLHPDLGLKNIAYLTLLAVNAYLLICDKLILLDLIVKYDIT